MGSRKRSLPACGACQSARRCILARAFPELAGHDVRLPAGNLLFHEGEAAEGIFVLCRGQVRIFAGNGSLHSLHLRDAASGDLLGLSGAIPGGKHEETAETAEDSQLIFVSAADFRRYLRTHGEVYLPIVRQLSEDLECAYTQVRLLAAVGH